MISRAFAGLPPHGRGQRIGLFGGSFNPPHEGHRAASLMVLRRLELDWIWWLVSPGNPLKDTRGLPPLAARMDMAQRVAAHPRIVVTGLEARLGSPYTFDLVTALRARCPSTAFVWIMGADSFVHFHLWKDWRRIAEAVPMAVIDRPGSSVVTQARAASALSGARSPENDARGLATATPPAYVFLHWRRSELSSTSLRSGT